jgi:predicted amidohydrolase
MASMDLRVALIQTDAGPDAERNVARAAELAEIAAAGGARLVALPEYLQYRGPDDGYRASARAVPGPFTEPFAAVARRHGCWILAGSLAERSEDPRRPYNTSVVIGPSGEIAARYRKIHLFDVAVDAGPSDVESARVSGGADVVVADLDGVRLGLSICYDLRFPELYRSLALAGAEVLAVPSNFTERTGRDHWEVLLRARAIENGAWVIAPSQIGGPPGQPAYGHTMVVDPWGIVVAQAPDREGIVEATIDLDRVAAVRRQIPALANRRPAAYRLD